jgi:hypothetical protein
MLSEHAAAPEANVGIGRSEQKSFITAIITFIAVFNSQVTSWQLRIACSRLTKVLAGIGKKAAHAGAGGRCA